MSRRSWRCSAAVSFAWAAWSTSAGAEPVERAASPIESRASARIGSDGLYGRFEGDLDLSLATGVELLRNGPGAAASFRAFYLETAGLYVTYASSFGNRSAVPPRSLGVGVGLRPFFIPRWGNDLDRGPAIVDLTLDATTFDVGVLWAADQAGSFTQAAGIELGVGTEVPLTGQAAGPWLGVRGALRWRGSELAASDSSDPGNLGPAVFFTLAWHVLVNTHIVDVGDRVFR
jgi:hypothetical protein